MRAAMWAALMAVPGFETYDLSSLEHHGQHGCGADAGRDQYDRAAVIDEMEVATWSGGFDD
jgi:hypothetical protein